MNVKNQLQLLKLILLKTEITDFLEVQNLKNELEISENYRAIRRSQRYLDHSLDTFVAQDIYYNKNNKSAIAIIFVVKNGYLKSASAKALTPVEVDKLVLHK